MASSSPQHLRALERANRVRLARAELKRSVAAQQTSASEVILACPWQAESMSVSELLMSQRRWGRTRCRRVLLTLGVPENKRIGTLTKRQRQALAGMLESMSPQCSGTQALQPAVAAGREAIPALT